jgi:hypothetical protein
MFDHRVYYIRPIIKFYIFEYSQLVHLLAPDYIGTIYSNASQYRRLSVLDDRLVNEINIVIGKS